MENITNANSKKKIIISTYRFDRQSGWQECGGYDDTFDLDDYPGSTMPEEAKTWLMEYLFDEMDNHDLWDETGDEYGDYKVRLEMVRPDYDPCDGKDTVYDTEEYWMTELAKDYLAYRLDLGRDIIDLACDILHSGTWDMDKLASLCAAADMTAEWEAADGDTFESVAYAAADKLGVRIV